jgi:Ca2+-binding RTX toxin-like protein
VLDTVVTSASWRQEDVESLANKGKGRGLVRRTILLLGAIMVTLVVAGGVALAAADCRDEGGTGLNCYCHPGVLCEGTNISAGEYIWGTQGSDTIEAYAGHDYIAADWGSEGSGSKNDTIDAGPGKDYIDGGPGWDTCDGGDNLDDPANHDIAENCEDPVRIDEEW